MGKWGVKPAKNGGVFDAAGPSTLGLPASSVLIRPAVDRCPQLPPSKQKRGAITLSLPDTVGPGSDFHKAGLVNLVCHTRGIVIGHCALAAERTRLVEGSG